MDLILYPYDVVYHFYESFKNSFRMVCFLGSKERFIFSRFPKFMIRLYINKYLIGMD